MSGAGSGPDVEVLRRAWPEILQTLTKIKRSTWALVEPNAQVGHFEDHVLTLAFTTSGLAGAFGRADHSENLRQAIHKTIGIECQITAVASGSNSAASSEPNPKAPVSRDVPATPTDADWGLPPADVPAQATPHRSAEAPQSAPPPSAVGSGCSTASRHSGRSGCAGCPAPSFPLLRSPRPGHPLPRRRPPLRDCCPRGNPRPRAPANERQGASSEAAGSYAYPDDDWGPPRDEDAPPLDEEPPMDWDPSAPAVARSVQPAAAPATVGQRKAAPARSRAASKPAPANDPAPQAPDTADDPWARAVEEAPGSGRSARIPMSGATGRRSP